MASARYAQYRATLAGKVEAPLPSPLEDPGAILVFVDEPNNNYNNTEIMSDNGSCSNNTSGTSIASTTSHSNSRSITPSRVQQYSQILAQKRILDPSDDGNQSSNNSCHFDNDKEVPTNSEDETSSDNTTESNESTDSPQNDNTENTIGITAPSQNNQSDTNTVTVASSVSSSTVTPSPPRYQQYRAKLAQTVHTTPPPPLPTVDAPPSSPVLSPSVKAAAHVTAGSPARYTAYRSTLAQTVPTAQTNHDSAEDVALNEAIPNNNQTEDSTPGLISASTKATHAPENIPRYATYRNNLAGVVPATNQLATNGPSNNNNSSKAAEDDTQTSSQPIISPSTKAAAQAMESSSSQPRYTTYRSTLAQSVAAVTNAIMTTIGGSTETTNAEKQNRVSGQNEKGTVHANKVTDEKHSNSPESSNSGSSSEEEGGDESSTENNKAAEKQPDDYEPSMQEDTEDDVREINDLGTKLSAFLARAEKGKPPIPPEELDMHTSWSDFDTKELNENASRVSSASHSQRNLKGAVDSMHQKTIQKALAEQAMIARQTMAKKSEEEAKKGMQEDIRQNIQSERLRLHQEQVKQIAEKEESYREKDLESGELSEGPEAACPVTWRTVFLAFSIMVGLVLIILAFVFGLKGR